VAEARRAKPRLSRVLMAVITAAVALLVGGAVAVLLFWRGSLTAIIPTQTESSPAAESSATPSQPPTSTPTPSDTPSSSAKPEPTASATPARSSALKALDACRSRVRAADAVLKQARTGVRHWEAHVGAERRAKEGTISIADRERIFEETRLQGPGDQKRYADALRAYDRVKDARCGKNKGADAKVAATLASCQKRAIAQAPVMRTAAAAMGDWKQHLADMQRSAVEHNKDAQQVWINAYKAAPQNIDPYERAARAFKKAPKC